MRSVSYLRAHNLQFSASDGIYPWLIPGITDSGDRFRFQAAFSRESDVPELYDDIKSKDQAKILQRLQTSYGKVYDAVAKIESRITFGRFTQKFSANGAAAMLVNDPVFPELSGLITNDFLFSSAYVWMSEKWLLRPMLTYGVRRTLDESFSVGQLLENRPNLKIRERPYLFIAELHLDARWRERWGEMFTELRSVPMYEGLNRYWEWEIGFRSPNLLKGIKRTFPWRIQLWSSAAPLYGGNYDWKRTAKAGIMVEWFRYLQTDVFFRDDFRFGGIVRMGTPRLNLMAYTFARSENDPGTFVSRQYGLNLTVGF